MKPVLKPLLVGASLAAGIAMFAVACGDRSPLPVSPSTVPVAGVDGSAAKGTKNFCVYVRAHESDDIYVVGQPVYMSLTSRATPPVPGVDFPSTTTSPHGEVCFSLPTGTQSVFLYIDYQTTAVPPAEAYCLVNWVEVAVHNGPSYFWIVPNDGEHDCSYPDQPY
jgi:hypothetical protein